VKGVALAKIPKRPVATLTWLHG